VRVGHRGRLAHYYDDVEPGLAQFVHDIVLAGGLK
jgi:hypothetical protein